MRSRPLRSVLAVCGLLVSALLSAPAAHATTTQQLRLIQYNIAGGGNGGALGILDFLNDRIAEYQPDVVTLEEVCATQFHAFQAQHPTWNVWWVHLIAAPDYHYCGSGDDARIGEVLASPWPLSNLVVNALGPSELRPYPWGTVAVDYRLMCADLDVGGFAAGKVRACVTHLRPGGNATAADRATDTSIIRSRLHTYVAAGSEVVLGGDFNAIPSRAEMDDIYKLTTGNSPSGPGDFWEADENYNCQGTRCRGGEITHPAVGAVGPTKIDYGFYSTNHVTGRLSGLPYGDDAPTHPDNLCTASGGIKTVDCSDHYLYRAYATVTL